MEIKFELDMKKVAKATIAIAASYELGRVSEGTEYPQIAFANVIALIAIIAILYGPRHMMSNVITHLFKETHDAFPPLKDKPSNDDLLAIWEILLPLHMVIPYNQLNRVHSLTAILTKAIKYKADHGAKFVHPACLPLSDKTIADKATTVVHIRAEAAH